MICGIGSSLSIKLHTAGYITCACVSACLGYLVSQHASAQEVAWDDGDSGRIGRVKFRLSDVDAPETWRPKCEAERELGYAAKAFMQDLTEGRRVTITSEDGYDRWDRLLVTLSVNGQDLAQAGLEAGVLREWPHDGRRALADRPNWCDQEEPAQQK